MAKTGLAAALTGADATLAGAAFTGGAFADTISGAALAAGAFGDCLAFALAGGGTAFADALGFVTGVVATLGVFGDFILVGDADRVGGGAGFALVGLAEARFTGAAVFAGVAFVVLVTGLACVIFGAVACFEAGVVGAVGLFEEVVLRPFATATAAFGPALATAAFPAMDLD